MSKVVEFQNADWWLPEAASVKLDHQGRLEVALRCVQKTGSQPGKPEFLAVTVQPSLHSVVAGYLQAQSVAGYRTDSFCITGKLAFNPLRFEIDTVAIHKKIYLKSSTVAVAFTPQGGIVSEESLDLVYLERTILKIARNGQVYTEKQAGLQAIGTYRELIAGAEEAMLNEIDFKINKQFIWKRRPNDCLMAKEVLREIATFVEGEALIP